MRISHLLTGRPPRGFPIGLTYKSAIADWNAVISMHHTAPKLPYLSITQAGSRVAGGNVAMFPRGLFAAGVPRFLRISGIWPEIRLSFTDVDDGPVKQLIWRGSHWQASLPTAALAVPPNLEIRSRDSRAVCRRVGATDYSFNFAGRDMLTDAALREGMVLLARLEHLAREHPGLEQALGIPLGMSGVAPRRP